MATSTRITRTTETPKATAMIKAVSMYAILCFDGAKVQSASEADVSLAEKYVSKLGNFKNHPFHRVIISLLFLLFFMDDVIVPLCSLPELATSHAVGVAEEAGQGGSTGDAGELADDGNGLVGGLQ